MSKLQIYIYCVNIGSVFSLFTFDLTSRKLRILLGSFQPLYRKEEKVYVDELLFDKIDRQL